ncbi:MAG: hypothetical protein WBV36_04695 [Terriglobales bacterium]
MTPRKSKTRDAAVAQVDDLLRGKLIEIREVAMELSAILEFGKPDGVAADPLWRFAQQAIKDAESLLPSAHRSGIAERDELLDELRNSLEARCESCRCGIEHDEAHCPLSDDEVDLLKKQRELALPAARIASYDEFAKWLFTIITVVGTLGAAFSNTALKKLCGVGAILFFLAIAATGLSLALAVILRCVEPEDANWQSLPDMLEKGRAALKSKRYLAWASGIWFAAAIVLAGVSPLFSGDESCDPSAKSRTLTYSLGKDGIHVSGTFGRHAQGVGEIRVSAVGLGEKPSESLLAAQRIGADPQGVLRFDITSTAIPQQTGSIKISIVCDPQSNGKEQEFSLPLQPASDKLITIDSHNPCFE